MRPRNKALSFLIICDCVTWWGFRFLHPLPQSVLWGWARQNCSGVILCSQLPPSLADAVARRCLLFEDLSFVSLSLRGFGDCVNIWFIHCSLRKISAFQWFSLILQPSSRPGALHFGSRLCYRSTLSLAREGHNTSPKAIMWLHIHRGSKRGSIFVIQPGFNRNTWFHFGNDHSLPPHSCQWVGFGDNFTYLTCKVLRETLGYLLKMT